MTPSQGSEVRKRASTKKPSPAAEARADDPSLTGENGVTPSREARIREVAYALYENRGGVDGNDLDDWLTAEAAVSGESFVANPTAAPSED